MDPLTALSLAGTVVQFVDFGCKLLSEGRQLYKSTSGKLQSNEEIEIITLDLQILLKKLNVSLLPSVPGAFTKQQAEETKSLQLICDQASTIAEEMIRELEKLTLPSNAPRKTAKTFKQLLKARLSSHKIADMVARLTELRKAIDTNLLFSARENIDLQTVRLSARFDQVDVQTQRILTSLLDNQNAVNQQVITAVAQMMSRLEVANDKAHQQTQSILSERYNMEQTVDITTSISMLAVSSEEETNLREDIQTTIIKSLEYPTMTNRYEDIGEAFPQTLEWAFQDQTDENLPRANLATWLKTGKGQFWVSGKPGSGKSTLMKHLFDDRRTWQYLQHWAKTIDPIDAPLHIATFFFWNSGTPEQKSQAGLLRALLYQILRQTPDLVPVVFPAFWADVYSKYLDRQERESKSLVASKRWQLRELKMAMKLLVGQTQIPIKLFFLIDGLDEFEEDHEDLVIMFRDITQLSKERSKICLSSRPLVIFEDSFRACASLKMQNLTYKDIEIYVNERLYENPAFQRLAEEEPEEMSELIQELVQKADGVFLWVRIVVKSLLSGIRNLDEMSDLWRRLRLLPKELEPLYEHLMGLIDPIYMEWASKVFRIVQTSRGIDDKTGRQKKNQPSLGIVSDGLTLIVLYLAINDNCNLKDIRKMKPESIDSKCRTFAVQLTARCAGFLEIPTSKDQENIAPTSSVIFLHRTARDFLEDKTRWKKLLAVTLGTSFDPVYALVKGLSSYVVLKWSLYGEGLSYLVMVEMCAIALDALRFAYQLSARDFASDQLLGIFEEMGKVVSWNEVGRQRWTYILITGSTPQTPVLTFLDLAALFGVSQYVLRQLPGLAIYKLSALLRLLLSVGPNLVVPAPSEEIVSALLSYGAVLEEGMQNHEIVRTLKKRGLTRKREDVHCEDLFQRSHTSDESDSDSDDKSDDESGGDKGAGKDQIQDIDKQSRIKRRKPDRYWYTLTASGQLRRMPMQ
ncbi:hypothetical protein O988_06049 [Pseudogymnoascus sp. VKM F-3808]|nr:hypothetical protein O988_06049 [Pseudogymnoascus sp. VKM F-3808]